MTHDPEVLEFLLRHLNAIYQNDVQAYHATTAEDLTLYEWWVTPHRLDGLPFHDFMMTENARRGMAFGAETGAAEHDAMVEPGADERPRIRFDLANLHIQRYADTAIASYTLLTSTGTAGGVRVAAHNESRVMIKSGDHWKVVHVHKSPAWQAPHVQP
jgi:ketosteroid isomerase-like protein